MLTDITEFLPKYPDISKFDDVLFDPYIGTDFYQGVFKKKELNELRLENVEQFPQHSGELMRHQELISRFLSSHTLYNELLLIHEMGTGKTCSAGAAIEKVRNENSGIKRALYLAKGEGLINNFIDEIIFKCTDGRYIPKNYKSLTDLEKVHRKKKAINDFYSWGTFETFAKQINRMSPQDIHRDYDNTIIVIDEVHNLRIQDVEKGLHVYNQFWKFLHNVSGCKILLMSGTPMKDGVEELASVLNLILPKNKQFPTGEEFLMKFFDQEDEIYKIKPEKVATIKSAVKGKISYLKAMTSSVTKTFEGESLNLDNLTVYPSYMSKHQTESYVKAYENDKTQGFYLDARQASLFVYPDGSYGEIGFQKYIKQKESVGELGKDGVMKKIFKFAPTTELHKAIFDQSHEKMLANIAKCSCKYAESIRLIIEGKNEGKLVFVYNEFVKGSGLILFGILLEMFGYAKANGKEKTPHPRYATLTNLTSTDRALNELKNRFNQNDNIHGDYIQIILGSRRVSEGFSFRNVQIEDIQTPWFNYSETSQAIARGIRVGSHNGLIEEGIDPVVSIYQQVAIPQGVDSIDLQMYKISEKKDISIKGVERLLKESAFDCALAYNRNHIVGQDGLRDCEYMDCEYLCDDVPPEWYIGDQEIDLDFSTYNLYYIQDSVKRISNYIVSMFDDTFSLDLNIIKEKLPEFTSFEILTALRELINKSHAIYNKYNLPSYIKESNNRLYLVDSLSVIGEISTDYYTEYPTIKKYSNYNDVMEPIYIESLPPIIMQLCDSRTMEEVRELLSRLPQEVHEFLIEASILAEKLKIDQSIEIRELLLEFFNSYYGEFDGVWVSWYLDEENPRCLFDRTWADCPEGYTELIRARKQQAKTDLENNPYGFYGQINTLTNDFCIRDVSEDIPTKKTQQKTGSRCRNWKKPRLIDLTVKKLKIPIPTEFPEVKVLNKFRALLGKMNTRAMLLENLQSANYSKNLFTAEQYASFDDQELQRILFWSTLQVGPMCHFVKEWFYSKDLISNNLACGVAGQVE